MQRIFLNLLATLAPLAAQAQTARPFAAPAAINTVAPAGAGSLAQVTLALGVVLAVIFGAAWVVRRMRGFAKSQGAALDIIANLPLSQKERAVLIRCGSTQILLGVAPGNVNLLHVLNEPVNTNVEAGPAKTAATDFKAVLKRSLGL